MFPADETNSMRFGNYEVLTKPDGTPDELGRGGFGRTYRARHALIHTEHALKVILDRLVNDTTVTERFLREAREQAALRHPGIAQITDFGIHRDGTMFYVMEYCSGGDLKSHARKVGPLPEAATFKLIRQAAEALSYAHGKGLIHRDIKPSNLMLVFDDDGQPQVKIIDFGLVKRLAQEGAELDPGQTQTGESLWSPAFASPEQIKESALDARSDIFSLGMTAWFMLLGGGPVEGSQGVILADRLGPGNYEPRLPRTLSGPGRALLAALVEKDPRRRPKSCAELIRRIDAVLDGTAEMPVWDGEKETHDSAGIPVSPLSPPIRLPELHTRFSLEGVPVKKIFLGEILRGTDGETGLNVRVTRVARKHPESIIEMARERVDALVKARPAGIVPLLEMTEFREGWVIVEEDIVDGIILGDALKREGAVEFATAAPLLWQAAEGLDAAVRAGAHVTLIERSLICSSGALSPGSYSRLPWASLQLRLSLEMVTAKKHELELDQTLRSDVTAGQARNPLQSLATLIYIIVGARPVPLSAYFSEFAYDAIPGLSENGNHMLAQALAGENGGSAMAFLQALAQSEPSSPGAEAIARVARESARAHHLARLEASLPPLVTAAAGCEEIIAACDRALRRPAARERFAPLLVRNQELRNLLTQGRQLFSAATADPGHALIYDHALTLRRSAILVSRASGPLMREAAAIRASEEEFNAEFEKTSALITRLLDGASALEQEARALGQEGAALAASLQTTPASAAAAAESATVTRDAATAAAAGAGILRIQRQDLPAAGHPDQLAGMREAAHAAHAALSTALGSLRVTVGTLRGHAAAETARQERGALLDAIAPLLDTLGTLMAETEQDRTGFSLFLEALPAARRAAAAAQSRESSRIQSELTALRAEITPYFPPASRLDGPQLRLLPDRLRHLAAMTGELRQSAARLISGAEEAIALQEQDAKAGKEEKQKLLASVPALSKTTAAHFWEIEAQLSDVAALLPKEEPAPDATSAAGLSALRNEVLNLERDLIRQRGILDRLSGPQAGSLDLETLRQIPVIFQNLEKESTALLTAVRSLKTRAAQAVQRGNLARYEATWQYLDACAAYAIDCFNKVSLLSSYSAQGQKTVDAAQAACHKARAGTREILKARKSLLDGKTSPSDADVESLEERAALAADAAHQAFSRAAQVTADRHSVPVAPPPERPSDRKTPVAQPLPPSEPQPQLPELRPTPPPPEPPPDPAWPLLTRQAEALSREAGDTTTQIRQELDGIPENRNPTQRREAAAALEKLEIIRREIGGLHRQLTAPAPEEGSPLTAEHQTRLDQLAREFDQTAGAAQKAIEGTRVVIQIPVRPEPDEEKNLIANPCWDQLMEEMAGQQNAARTLADQAVADLNALPGASAEETAWVREAAAAAHQTAQDLTALFQKCRNSPAMNPAACGEEESQATALLDTVREYHQETARRISVVKEAIGERATLEQRARNARQILEECDSAMGTFQELRQQAALLRKKTGNALQEYRHGLDQHLQLLEERFTHLWELRTWAETRQSPPHVAAGELHHCRLQIAELLDLPALPPPPVRKSRRKFFLIAGGTITGITIAMIGKHQSGTSSKKLDADLVILENTSFQSISDSQTSHPREVSENIAATSFKYPDGATLHIKSVFKKLLFINNSNNASIEIDVDKLNITKIPKGSYIVKFKSNNKFFNDIVIFENYIPGGVIEFEIGAFPIFSIKENLKIKLNSNSGNLSSKISMDVAAIFKFKDFVEFKADKLSELIKKNPNNEKLFNFLNESSIECNLKIQLDGPSVESPEIGAMGDFINVCINYLNAINNILKNKQGIPPGSVSSFESLPTSSELYNYISILMESSYGNPIKSQKNSKPLQTLVNYKINNHEKIKQIQIGKIQGTSQNVELLIQVESQDVEILLAPVNRNNAGIWGGELKFKK